MNPIKYLLEKPIMDDHLSRWSQLLSEFDITFKIQKSIKGSAIAEHLPECPVASEFFGNDDFPDEQIMTLRKTCWRLYFDGAVNHKGKGAGILLIHPEGDLLPAAVKINYPVTNNMAEYEACILGLEMALELQVEELEV